MNRLSPQARIVLDHLRRNSHLTSWQAEGVYRIRRLASRIDELRRAGYEVETSQHRDATGQRYTRYSLSRRQRRAKGALLPARTVPLQVRMDDLVRLYRTYCRDELGVSSYLDEEVAEFRKYIEENV